MVVSALNLGQLNIGLGVGFSGISIPGMREQDSLDFNDSQIGLFGKFAIIENVSILQPKYSHSYISLMCISDLIFSVALLSIGQVLGCIVSAITCTYLGRKIAVLLSCMPGLLGWILQVKHNLIASLSTKRQQKLK